MNVVYLLYRTKILTLLNTLFRLLYAVFVVSSENATVAELAATLQADLSQLQAAASFACRLGWAIKIIDPASILQDTSVPNSPRVTLSDEDEAYRASIGSGVMSGDGDYSQQGDSTGTENYGPCAGLARVAFIVDANITSYLMMGSVSPGLVPPLFCPPFLDRQIQPFLCGWHSSHLKKLQFSWIHNSWTRIRLILLLNIVVYNGMGRCRVLSFYLYPLVQPYHGYDPLLVPKDPIPQLLRNGVLGTLPKRGKKKRNKAISRMQVFSGLD